MTDSDQISKVPEALEIPEAPDISELITDFVEHIEVEKGRAQNTAENYERYLYRFLEIAGDISNKGNTLKPPISRRSCYASFAYSSIVSLTITAKTSRSLLNPII